ncbi:alpha/beta fold hydrolase (plasmid) [Sphingobium yanoikuyae]|uniref:Alpha/beta fold hydrolase n=1 Tax=Sphingobium yanoikuyae TaxID=13690 RepID=A0A6M4GEW4_SPHYA|nr:alpha/beta fold hydrolase [Sphingobium yanoikuyae]QJR05705.1 alpha/beta fold hydrolase [Sphingobium yanoikuyae]
MATFLLISGAWHASWCWERIAPLLRTSGHKVVAPDLLGMGPDPTPVSTVTLADWADQVAQLVREQDEPVILVGHSRGGIVISEVGERVPEHIDRLVYLSAFMLADGVSVAQASSRVPHTHQADVMERRPDNTTVIRQEAVGSTFYNTTPSEWVARAEAQVSAEPLSGLVTPVHVTEKRYGKIPRAYIECTEDRAVPLELQRAFQADLPCNSVITLETDHSPFYSAPELLVSALEGLVAPT